MPYAPISATDAGDNTVVAGVPGRKIRVQNLTLVPGGAVSLTWKSGSTDISGAMPLAANIPISLKAGGPNASGPDGVLQCAGGEPLILNLSDAVAVGGHLRYEVVT